MLPRPLRIARRADWDRLHRRGVAVHSRALVMKFQETHRPHTRFGFIVGVKVSKQATVRNQVKRRLRAFVAAERPTVKSGYDIIFIARTPSATMSASLLQQTVRTLLHRGRLLNR
ncbi:MAG: ribonuclease P protein component [Candidatus Kerfeldbacteria bacterium]|nr:ribonuclease P protein component [Candidatus Kerfeldbacteria bacterium]